MDARSTRLRRLLTAVREWLTEISEVSKLAGDRNGRNSISVRQDWHRAQSYLEVILEKKLAERNSIDVQTVLEEKVFNQLYEQIRKETTYYNRNNILRTSAYLKIYEESKELHWALLAHLVSRNSGYNMTDLRGQFGQMTLGFHEQDVLFGFLEQCNSLTFQNAYPQIRLYQLGKKHGKSWIGLLRLFHVSVFMEAVWDTFLEFGTSSLLTIALIVNEQSYIEKRVIQNDNLQNTMFPTSFFHLQELFHLTSIIFPALAQDGAIDRYFGFFMDDFLSLQQRIRAGKALYMILFQGSKSSPREELVRFAHTVPHTGSRADYLPMLFSKRSDHGGRFFSPELQKVWRNSSYPPISPKDWCFNSEVVSDLTLMQVLPQKAGDITEAYLRKLSDISLLAQMDPFS